MLRRLAWLRQALAKANDGMKRTRRSGRGGLVNVT